MKFESKFDVGDHVYFISGEKVAKATISALYMERHVTAGSGEVHHKLEYRLTVEKSDIGHSRPEKSIAASQDDLFEMIRLKEKNDEVSSAKV
jgi:hypothetical protein